MIEIFCGKSPQNDRKPPQSYSANEPYLPPKGDDPEVIAARQRRQEQRKIVLETAAAWAWYFLSKGLSVFVRVETWIVIVGVAAVFGVSYAVWLLAVVGWSKYQTDFVCRYFCLCRFCLVAND